MLNIIFATHNGEQTLRRMLPALADLQSPSCPWRIIAVDNASTDGSLALLQQAKSTLPITVLECNQRGKNRALNSALKHVDGDLIVFTDDDVLPKSDWLLVYEKLSREHADCDIFGGLIIPEWPSEPTPGFLEWVPTSIVYGLTPETTRDGPVAPGLIWGANMAIRKRVFDGALKFNEDVGPAPGQYIMGSETELTRKAVGDGNKCWFCRDAVVSHLIREAQLDERWVLERGFRYGRGAFSANTCENTPMLLGAPRWLWRVYLTKLGYQAWCRVFASRAEYLRASWELQVMRGQIYQARSV